MSDSISKQDLLNALKVKKGVPLPLTKPQLAQAKSLLGKHLTLSEAFDVIELMTYPYNNEMKKVSGRLSVANIVLDKVARHEGMRKSTLDKYYKEAEEEFKKANDQEIAQAKAEFQKMAKDMKKDD